MVARQQQFDAKCLGTCKVCPTANKLCRQSAASHQLPSRGSLEGLLNCSVSASPVYCVQASPNPEFAANPRNFAHFWLAHVFSIANGLNVERPFKSTLLLFHGHNRVLPRHASTYVDLLGAGAQCTTSSALKAVTVAQQEERRRFFRCDQYVQSASVPLFAFRNRSFFSPAPWRRFALAVRSHLWTPPSIRHDNLGRIVVLLRATTVKLGMRIVEGLPLACDDAWASSALSGLRMRVDCLRLGPASTMLSSSARALGDAVGLLAGHGSGLAMLPFLPIGSRFAELDHIHNAARARNMYQYLADALGLNTMKVWTNGSGVRFCPRRTIGCTAGHGGTSIHGCVVGYTSNVTLSPGVLREVLREVAIGGALRDCGIANDTFRPKVRRPLNIDEELHRLY